MSWATQVSDLDLDCFSTIDRFNKNAVRVISGNSKKLFSGLVDIDESSEENDEDFYKNESSEEETKPDEEA